MLSDQSTVSFLHYQGRVKASSFYPLLKLSSHLDITTALIATARYSQSQGVFKQTAKQTRTSFLHFQSTSRVLLGCGKTRSQEKIIIKQSPLQSPKSAASLSGNQTTAQRHPSAAATSVSYIKSYFSLLQVRALSIEGQRNRKLSSKDLPLDLLSSVLGIACRALGNRRAISKNSVGFSTSSLQTNLVYVKPKG